MKEIYPLIKDTFYKKSDSKFYIRKAVRAFLFNEENKFCLLYINGTDKFGKRDHFETPGGGVENDENLIDTLKREMSEETGYTIKDIKEIGKISIQYNLLNRIDEEYYYYCKTDSLHETSLLEYEKNLFEGLKWFTIDEAIDMYKHYKTNGCGIMIHERDLNALLYLKNYILNNAE
jgi:8-oxo-dGTP pyrophosphatase MutT (NUDIX family)